MGRAPRHDVVAEHADALDLRLDVVTGLQVELERVLQNADNLLAIMQNGAFCKLSAQLSAAG